MEKTDEKESGGPTAEKEAAVRMANGCERALLVSTQEGIRLLGGAAGIWNRCLAAGWIRPVRAGRIEYYRYGDIAALAERLCCERPPRLIINGREELRQQ